MSDLINREELLSEMEEYYERRSEEANMTGNRSACVTWNDAVMLIKNAPTVDAEPVRHGHWNGIEKESRGYTDIFECSECKCYVRTPFMMKVMEYDFCPSCGAKMDGGADGSD